MLRLARPRFSLRFKLLVSHLLVLAPPLAFSALSFWLAGGIVETDMNSTIHQDRIRRLDSLEAYVLRADAAAARSVEMAGLPPERRKAMPNRGWDETARDALEMFDMEFKSVGDPAFAEPDESGKTAMEHFKDFRDHLNAWMDQRSIGDASAESRDHLLHLLNARKGFYAELVGKDRKLVIEANVRLIYTMVGSMLAALAAAVAGALILTRTLLRPVTDLEETLKAYERGEAPPKPERLPSDELGDLGRSMREALSKMDTRREHLEHLSLTDPLTGLHNRRYLDEILGRLRKRETPAAFIMADIDHFKAYNDKEGHLMGDQLLQEVANLLHRNVRPGDVVARFGGEEFCVLFLDAAPGERPAGPENVERLRILFENHPFPRTESQPDGRLTISIGGTHWKPGEEPLEALKRADAALYQAKQSGRNRCAWA